MSAGTAILRGGAAAVTLTAQFAMVNGAGSFLGSAVGAIVFGSAPALGYVGTSGLPPPIDQLTGLPFVVGKVRGLVPFFAAVPGPGVVGDP